MSTDLKALPLPRLLQSPCICIGCGRAVPPDPLTPEGRRFRGRPRHFCPPPDEVIAAWQAAGGKGRKPRSVCGQFEVRQRQLLDLIEQMLIRATEERWRVIRSWIFVTLNRKPFLEGLQQAAERREKTGGTRARFRRVRAPKAALPPRIKPPHVRGICDGCGRTMAAHHGHPDLGPATTGRPRQFCPPTIDQIQQWIDGGKVGVKPRSVCALFCMRRAQFLTLAEQIRHVATMDYWRALRSKFFSALNRKPLLEGLKGQPGQKRTKAKTPGG